MITLIAAIGHGQIIGYQNQLPWHLRGDLQHFKQHTLHQTIVMGRRTYESIGKALPERHNIILTRQKGYHAPGCTVINDLDTLIAENPPEKTLIIMGGATLYEKTLPIADTLLLTQVDYPGPGDTHFPLWNPDDWEQTTVSAHKADEHNDYDYTFITLQRRAPSFSRSC